MANDDECKEWRPLAMKGICECLKRWHQHSDAVKVAAMKRQIEKTPDWLESVRVKTRPQ